jgi:glycosyltransferase involved in cell wall biosynthesis
METTGRNPTVAVVIRCFNEEAHIGRLLTGVLAQTHKPEQVTIVDSGSTDATLAIASTFPVEIVRIAPEDFSFGRALNTGLATVETDVAVLASAHVFPIYDTWIERLVAPFGAADVALSYGRQEAPVTGRFSERQIFARWYPPQSVPRQRHPFCNNANAAIRVQRWSEQPYDEGLTGLEDMDWAKKALAAGYAISYVAEAPVVHVHSETFQQVVNRYRREAIAHKRIHDDHRMGAPLAARLWLASVLGDLGAAGREGVRPSHAADIFRFRLAQFYGTYRGFAQQGPTTELLKRRFFYPTDPQDRAQVISPDPPGRPIEYDEPMVH